MKIESTNSERLSHEVDSNEAMMVIQSAIDNCSRTGAVDTERDDLLQLQQALLSGKITPLEVKQRVEAIMNSRQDYH
jgi:hypothetical protein